MEHIRRNERMAALTKLLTSAPNQIFTLSHFCELFGAAKSTMSEDIDLLKGVFTRFELGQLETVTGAAGGVRYRRAISPEKALRFVDDLCQQLSTTSRVLPGGFLYLSDILSQHELVTTMGTIIAQQYYDARPDFVLTMETKGIPVALMAAEALGLPLVIARRSSKVYEGPAVNINYVSGSGGHIETMSLNRRAVTEGTRALIVDDFLKAGGTAKGMIDLMAEFHVDVIGTAFVMSTATPQKKQIENDRSLMVMDVDPADPSTLTVRPADWLTEAIKG